MRTIGQHHTALHALIELAQPHLPGLAEQTHESASLAALDGAEVVHVARVPVRRIMSINVSLPVVEREAPAHAALVAGSPEPFGLGRSLRASSMTAVVSPGAAPPRTTTLHACVGESTPATRVIAHPPGAPIARLS